MKRLEDVLRDEMDKRELIKDRLCSTCSTRYDTLPTRHNLTPRDETMVIMVSPNLNQRGNLVCRLNIPLRNLRVGIHNQEYELQSVVDYRGTGTRGHYITASRRRGVWHLFNDKKVKQTTAANLVLECPVMLVYTRAVSSNASDTRNPDRVQSGGSGSMRSRKRSERNDRTNRGGNPARNAAPHETAKSTNVSDTKKHKATSGGATTRKRLAEKEMDMLHEGTRHSITMAEEKKQKTTHTHGVRGEYEGLTDRLINGKNLTCEDIAILLDILKSTYNAHALGLDDPIHQDPRAYQWGKTRTKPQDLWDARRLAPRTIQILHLPNHWVVAEHISGDSVTIYDTLPTDANKSIIHNLCCTIFDESNIIYEGLSQNQQGVHDCGPLAIAVVVDLIEAGRSPGQITYLQSACRQHIVDCLARDSPAIRPFPVETQDTDTPTRPEGRKRKRHSPGLQNKNWGNEEHRGYLYTEGQEKSVYLGEAYWLPSQIQGRKAHGRGLFAGIRIKKNQPITPYAGVGTFVSNDISGTEKSAFMKTLTKIGGDTYVIDGFRDPKPGYGMAQFCNDRNGTGRNNATLIVLDSLGGRGINSQMGIYLKAATDIEIGEEITINYGKSYFKKMKGIRSTEDSGPDHDTYTKTNSRKTKRNKRKPADQREEDTSTHNKRNKQSLTPEWANTTMDEEIDIEEEIRNEMSKHGRPESPQLPEPESDREPSQTARTAPARAWKGAISDIINNITDAHKPKILYHTKLEEPTRKYLRINQTINQHITKIQQSISWHTHTAAMEKIGATREARPTYMKGKRTWINLTGSPDKLKNLYELISEATDPRTLLATVVTQAEACNVKGHVEQHHQTLQVTEVATYQTSEVMITESTNTPWKLEEKINTRKLTLIAIHGQNVEISAQQTSDIQRDTRMTTNKIHSENRKESEEPNFHVRTEHSTHPSLTMHRTHPRQAAHHSQEHDRLARSLGILSKNTTQLLRTAGHKNKELNNDKVKRIEKILLHAATEAYRRYEVWMKRDLLRE